MRKPTNNKVTFPYGATSAPYSPSNPHAGTDYSYLPDDKIYAPENGTITASGNMGACGWGIDLQGSGGRKWRFCHMSALKAAVNQKVTEGQVIGIMGESGYASGKHLHLVLWINGVRQDPEAYLIKNAKGDNMTLAEARAIAKLDGRVIADKTLNSYITKGRGLALVNQLIIDSSKYGMRKKIADLQKALKDAKTALANEKNKPPEKVIETVTKIVEKPVIDQETADKVSKTNEMVTTIFDYFADRWSTFSEFLKRK